MSHQFFCSIANGLESAVQMELTEIGLPAYPSTGGVYTRVEDVQVGLLTRLRTPTSIRWQLVNGRAVRGLSDFRRILDGIDWSVFPKGSPIRLTVRTRKSKLNRSDILEDKAARFFTSVFGPADSSMQEIPVIIRLFENKMWVSVALHSGMLHQRGWRQSNVKTPIRENWAMALAYLANHQSDEAILDPFCGSGTMLIESGLRHMRSTVHSGYPWIFEEWGTNWTLPTTASVAPQSCRLLGADRDAPSVQKTIQNAMQSGVTLQAVECDVRHLTPAHFENCPESGLILCNPPYGIGSGRRTDAVYHWLGETWRTHFPNWRLYFIATDGHKAALVSESAEYVTEFSNAGIKVGFFKG